MLLPLLHELMLEPSNRSVSLVELFLSFVDLVRNEVKRVVDVVAALLW